VNPKHVEYWIQDFLQEAEDSKVPSTLMRVENKNVLARYGLDRYTLSGIMPGDSIDRI